MRTELQSIKYAVTHLILDKLSLQVVCSIFIYLYFKDWHPVYDFVCYQIY